MPADFLESIVSCLTPPGRGALATLGLRGPAVWAVLRTLFRTRDGKHLAEMPEIGRHWLGRIGTDMADECVLAVRSAEPVVVEVHIHGGTAVSAWLLELLREHGLRACSWEEWLSVTEACPLRATAVRLLALAPTERTASILLDQYHGALRSALVAIEAALVCEDASEATRLLGELRRWGPIGRHLVEPWRIVVAGAPNVGKSSLINALAGHQRSIVAPTPGTTRDLVTLTLAFDGWPVELIDTAGLRESAEEIERQGIAQAQEAAQSADLVLWVVDTQGEPTWPSGGRERVRVVVNKIDLPALADLSGVEGMRVSATTGEGIAGLSAAVARWLAGEPPALGTAMPIGERVCVGVELAAVELCQGRTDEALRVVRGLLGGQ